MRIIPNGSISICCHFIIERNGKVEDKGYIQYHNIASAEREEGLKQKALKKRKDGLYRSPTTELDGVYWYFRAHLMTEDCKVIR